MTIEQLRNVIRASPFRPFTMKLADGSRLRVKHPEFVSFSPAGRTAIVWSEGDSFEIVDLLLVASIEVGNGKAKSHRRS